jgi:hypothetical protein
MAGTREKPSDGPQISRGDSVIVRNLVPCPAHLKMVKGLELWPFPVFLKIINSDNR